MISIVFFLLSVFCIVYYGIVIGYSGLRTSFVGFWLFAAVFTAFLAIVVQSDFYLSLPAFITFIIKLFALLFIAFFIIILFCIIKAKTSYEGDVNYLIVPGAIVRGEKPSNALKERINAAYIYLSQHPETIAILSGFQNSQANLSQGKCMQNELRNMGIPAYRLLVEEHARTTEENLKFSKDYITMLHPKVGVLSNDFHIYRLLKIAKKCGYEDVEGIGTKTPGPILIHCYVREIFAVMKLIL